MLFKKDIEMEILAEKYNSVKPEEVLTWFEAGASHLFPENGGACIKYKDKQIAVFNFTRKKKWYACQNLCPHKMEMVLARGMIGDAAGIAKVACPLHKKTFSLENGENLNGTELAIAVYPVKIENNRVYVGFKD